MDSKHGFKKRRWSSSSSSASSSAQPGWVTRKKAPFYKSLRFTSGVSTPRNFRETVNYGVVELKTGLTFTGGVVSITAAFLGNFTNASAIFDTYRIRSYTVDFVPRGNQVFNTPSAVGGIPSTSGLSPLYTVIDYDDTTTPTSLVQLYEYESVKYVAAGRPHKRKIYPKTLTQLYESAISSGYAPKRGDWIDAATDDVPHLGLKWGITYPAPGSAVGVYDIIVTVNYQCKDQR